LEQNIKLISQVWARGLRQGLPWRDMIGISYCCDNDSEKRSAKIHSCKPGLGQGCAKVSSMAGLEKTWAARKSAVLSG